MSSKTVLGVFTCSIFLISAIVTGLQLDNECAAKQIYNRSVVCVCNSTYCDTVTRETPVSGVFFTYTTSEEGLRFKKGFGTVQPYQNNTSYAAVLELDASVLYQEIHGFGGAVTDSAGINWHNMRDPNLKQYFVDSYFSDSGLQYNMMRMPIGGSDFSTRAYSYDDLLRGRTDKELKHFKLAYEDHKFKIPLVKECMKAASEAINIVATCWSPPAWMKTNNNLTGIGYLKKDFFQTYADYHMKFLESYYNEGIPIWAVTTSNEPINSVIDLVEFNSLGWTVQGMADWIQLYLGPTIRNSKLFSNTKILCGDDQRNMVTTWFYLVALEYPEVLKYINGVAVHFYFDTVVPASLITETMADHPDLFVINTEACEGTSGEDRVDLGAWDRAESYATDIIDNLNHNYTGWIDWNLCLDLQGGPNWVKNYVDSPVIVDAAKGVFYKQPMFYIMGHFSKFIPRGSRRIQTTELFKNANGVQNVAFLTPSNTIVVVVFNKEEYEKTVILKLGDNQITVQIGKKSIKTVEFLNDGDVDYIY